MKHNKKKGLALKGRMHRSDLTDLLEGMAKDFKEGNIRIREGVEDLTLAVADNLEFEIRVDISKGRQKLVIELKWDKAEQVQWQGSSCISQAKTPSEKGMYHASESDETGASSLANAKESILTNEERLFFSTEENAFFANAWSTRKQLLGQHVYNCDNEKVGTVEDLIMTPGKAVSSAVIGTGETVGQIKRDMVIPVDQLIVRNNRLVVAGVG
ncbi:MAG: amphi-Trp domain-containing protein [Acidobacteriota bacterium]